MVPLTKRYGNVEQRGFFSPNLAVEATVHAHVDGHLHLFSFIFFSQMLINAMCCICLSGDPRDQGTSLLGNPLNTTNK